MKFIKTPFGWKAYARRGSAYVYIGHFYTQRAARTAIKSIEQWGKQ